MGAGALDWKGSKVDVGGANGSEDDDASIGFVRPLGAANGSTICTANGSEEEDWVGGVGADTCGGVGGALGG